MENRVSNLSFTSNIKFVPYSRYERIADMGLLGTKFLYEMCDPRKITRITNRGVTDQIIYCLSGVVQNIKNKRAFLFHWQPKKIVKDNEECRNATAKISKSLKNISAKNKFKGVLFGLISKDFAEENRWGKDLFKLLKKNFKIPNKKDYTMFLFQDAKGLKSTDDWPKINFVYCKRNDTFYVNCRKTIDGKWQDLRTKEQIRDHFGVIIPSANDKIFIGNEQVPNSFWAKFKKSDLVDFY